MNCYEEAIREMTARFGRDVAMPLATVSDGKPNIRTINAYFKEDAFYITTYALSSKMREIAANPNVALCHGLFVGHGKGVNLGSPAHAENRELAKELRRVFFAFYDRHVDEKDPNTCILKVNLTDAVICTDSAKYHIDFESKTADKQDFVNDIVF